MATRRGIVGTGNETQDEALRPPEQWLGFLLNQLAGIVRERTYAELKSLRLPPRSLGLMLVVNEQPGLSQTALFTRLGTDRTTMSQLVDTLVRRGLVARTADPSDRRNNRLELTEQGRRCLHQAASRALAVERELTADLDVDALNRLKAELSGLLTAMKLD